MRVALAPPPPEAAAGPFARPFSTVMGACVIIIIAKPAFAGQPNG